MDSSVQAQTTAVQGEEQPACHLLRTEKSIPMTKYQEGKGDIRWFFDIGMVFLWNWTLPGVCRNLGKGIITSISSGQGGNFFAGKGLPSPGMGLQRELIPTALAP